MGERFQARDIFLIDFLYASSLLGASAISSFWMDYVYDFKYERNN
jgi:hypothetical protein